jgi:hypothetical protein
LIKELLVALSAAFLTSYTSRSTGFRLTVPVHAALRGQAKRGRLCAQSYNLADRCYPEMWWLAQGNTRARGK